MITCLAGKILRLDPATDTGCRAIPTGTAMRHRCVRGYGNTDSAIRSASASKPGSGASDPSLGNPGTLLIGDVGWETWEELDVAASGGKNFGWPCNEGTHVTASYPGASPAHSDCSTLGTPSNPALATAPIADWSHIDDSQSSPPGISGDAAIGGQFYSGNLYPSPYRNQFFYGDYMGNWIKVARLDGSNHLIEILPFGDDMQNPVDFALHPTHSRSVLRGGGTGARDGNVYHIAGPVRPRSRRCRIRKDRDLGRDPPPDGVSARDVTLALPARASLRFSVLDDRRAQVCTTSHRARRRHVDAPVAGPRSVGPRRGGGLYFLRVPVGRGRPHGAARDPAHAVARPRRREMSAAARLPPMVCMRGGTRAGPRDRE